MMSKTVRRERSPGSPFGSLWLVDAPWAHPAWQQYLFSLADLETDISAPVVEYCENPSHELIVWAVDPKVQVATGDSVEEWQAGFGKALLYPPNHIQQFRAASDDGAYQIVAQVVELVEKKRLSPDSHYREKWNWIFAELGPQEARRQARNEERRSEL